MVKKGVTVIVPILLVLLIPVLAFALPNPAATYCKDLGYEYHKVRLDDGAELGYCNADGVECEEWDFYKGACAPEKSVCGINGYDTVTASDGEDVYSQEYAVCVERGPDPITGLAVYAGGKTGALGKFMKWLGSYLITGSSVLEGNTGGNVSGGAAGSDVSGIASSQSRVLASDLAGLHSSVKDQTVKIEPEEGAPSKPLPDGADGGDEGDGGDVDGSGSEPLDGDGRATTSAPSSFDWRDYDGENWITPIRNQGGCGSCWAFAAVGTSEAKMKIERGDPDFNPDLSEQELVSCSSAGDCGGGYHETALNYIKNNGIADEGCREYTASNSACGSCLGEDSRKWFIDDTHKYTDSSTSAAKQHLVDHGPLAVNYYHYGSFDADGVYKCSNECDPTSSYFYNHWDYGHCVTLVGYDDAGGYWIAKNSWGPYYQDNGYFKIGYGQCEILYGCPLDYSRNHVYVDKDWPDASDVVDVSSVSTYDGSYTGSIGDMQELDGDYLSYYDYGSGGDYDGVSAYSYFDEDDLQNPQRMTLFANVRGKDADDFELYRQYSTIEYLGYIPQSSDTFYLMKYELCDSESECESLFYNNYLRFIYTHPPCTSCSADYLDVDWFVVEALLDTDDDGVTDDVDACPDDYGTYCNGCPQPSCAPCAYDPTCPSSGAPYCAGRYSSSTLCDSTWRCSSGTGNNRYGTGGEYNCRGYCDGYGDCDYAGGCYYSASCDTDDDDDGVPDVDDDCAGTPGGSSVDSNGCRQVDVDQDLDGTCDPGMSSPSWCSGTDQCVSTYGTFCNGCPDISCGECRIDKVCPPDGAPYCSGYYGSTHLCDSAWRCSSGEGDGNYNTPGEYSCRGYCDGAGGCDFAKDCLYSADCDADDDNDGVADVDDGCAGTAANTTVDINGCSEAQVDSDSDGVCNIGKSSPLWCSGTDWCGSTPPGATVDYVGCSRSQVDSDSDGVCNDDYIFNTAWCDGEDLCSNSPKGYSVDSNGCAQVQVDYDLDGMCNPGASSPLWCSGSDSCPGYPGPVCNDGCPDEDAPPTMLNSPTGTTYASNGVHVQFVVGNKTENCLDSVWLVNGSSVMLMPVSFSGTMQFPKGNTTLTLYANDTSGNLNSSSVEFRVAFAPNITVHSPENTTYTEDPVVIDVTVDETVASINASLDQASPVLLCQECGSAYSSLGVGDGWHNLTLYVTDQAMDTFSRNFSFLVDSTPPEVHGYNFVHNQSITGNSSTVFSVNYSERFLSDVIFFLNTSQESVSGCSAGENQVCSVTRDLSSLAHGVHVHFAFRVNDTVGWTDTLFAPDDSGPYRLFIDRQAPVISVHSPSDGSVQDYFFYLNVSLDEEADLNYSLDSGVPLPACSSCRSFIRGFSNLSEGVHNFTLSAVDDLGHASSSFVNFSVDLEESVVDDDDDGVNNSADLCPYTSPGVPVDADGCARDDVDSDADGVCDPGSSSPSWCSGSDSCPGTPVNSSVDANGCRQVDVDQDLDGTCDPGMSSPSWCSGNDSCPASYGTDCNGCSDPLENPCLHTLVCPASGPSYYAGYYGSSTLCNAQFKCADSSGNNSYNTPGELSCQGFCDGGGNCVFAGNCSYSSSCDSDDDDDGVPDVNDSCSGTGSGGAVDVIGCNQTQVDSDRDGLCDTGMWSPSWCDLTDWCPDSALGDPVDANGCSQAQVDPDSDGVCTLGESSPVWCGGADLCANSSGPECNDGCPDSLPPVLDLISPEDDAYGRSNVSVHIVSSDCCLDSIVFFNGSVNSSVSSGIPVYRVYPDGVHTVTAFSNDTSGNLNSSSVSFLVDTVLPGVSVMSPGNGSEMGYWFWFNTSASENATLSYSLDDAGNVSLCSACDSSSVMLSGLDVGLHKLVVHAVDKAGNSGASVAQFRVAPDFDRDGVPDLLDGDDDGDGVPDVDDTLFGNWSHVDHNFGNFSVLVNRSSNLSRSFHGMLEVSFMDDGAGILDFMFNFSSRILNLSNMTVTGQDGTSQGSLFVRGIRTDGRTKTVFVDDLDPSVSTLCVKDAEVDSLDDISSDCSASDEHYISCPGTADGYTCTVNGSKYMVSGLQYSAVQELYVAPGRPPGGGGGGGGGSYSVVEEEDQEEKPGIDWSFLLPPDYSQWRRERAAEEPAPVTGEAPVEEASAPSREGPVQSAWKEGPAPVPRQGFVFDTVNIIISVTVLAGIIAGLLLLVLGKRRGGAEAGVKPGVPAATKPLLPAVVEHGPPARIAEKQVPAVVGRVEPKRKARQGKRAAPEKASSKRRVRRKPAGQGRAARKLQEQPVKRSRMQEIEDEIKVIKDKLRKEGL